MIPCKSCLYPIAKRLKREDEIYKDPKEIAKLLNKLKIWNDLSPTDELINLIRNLKEPIESKEEIEMIINKLPK